MSSQKLGGDGRIGSGKKLYFDQMDYGRSTHNLSKDIQTSMACGPLVPIYCNIGLTGDTWEIESRQQIRTLPTVGPLFGTFKYQEDYFKYDLRLSNKLLYNDTLDIGRKMESVLFPIMEITGKNITYRDKHAHDLNQLQVNPSSLIAYLGVRGLGQNITDGNPQTVSRQFFGVPLIAYWDIYKNYYANKQEEQGFVINTGDKYVIPSGSVYVISVNDEFTVNLNSNVNTSVQGDEFIIKIDDSKELTKGDVVITLNGQTATVQNITNLVEDVNIILNSEEKGNTGIYETSINIQSNSILSLMTNLRPINGEYIETYASVIDDARLLKELNRINLTSFALENIDNMRDKILAQDKSAPLVIDNSDLMPYKASTGTIENNSASFGIMAGLGIKTYQSDRFNNWLNSEWLDSSTGVNEISAIDVSEGKLFMDTLNIQKKVYYLLNRIAFSGGSYSDWQQSVYGQQGVFKSNNAVYCGGYSSLIKFNEVVSTSASDMQGDAQALGTLGGRGFETNEKGGRIKIKCDEDCIIMAIASITPYITYSQGNKWWNQLETMNDLHKPQFDGIGFQELMTDEMCAFATQKDNDMLIRYSAGKQPSWVEYMTDTNECFGTFAEPNNTMFMVLNRRYEHEYGSGYFEIKDLTTYIDPEKYNYAFAEQRLDAQNFWLSSALDIKVRRIMSAKVMPNF